MNEKKRRNSMVLVVFCLLAGAAGGVLRYLHLKTGFTAQGLAETGNPWGAALAWLSLGAALLLLAIAVYVKKSGAFRDSLRIGAIGGRTLALSFLASVALFAGGAFKIAGALPSFSVWEIIAGLLMLASAPVSVLSVRKIAGRFRDGDAVGGSSAVLLPVFLACFALIDFYRAVSANPSTAAYFYELASHIFLILALFAGGGYVFGRASLEKLFFMLTGYLYFGTVSMVSGWVGIADLISRGGLSLLIDGGAGLAAVAETFLFTYGFLFAAALLCLFFKPPVAAAADILGD